MKKGRIITAAVLAATMLMGAGYAAWTTNVTINHTVTTGNMKVEFTDPHYSSTEVFGSDYVQPSVARTNNNVAFTLNNLYPGATYSTLTEEKNTGSIAVKFDNATVSVDSASNAQLAKNLTVSFDCWVFDANGNHIDTVSPNQSNITLDNLAKVLNDTLKDVRLEPGQYLTLQGHSIDQYMNFVLNDGTNMDNSTQNQKLNFTIQLNWKQFNE